jgi:FixJ family two-component response regulator
MSRCSRISLVVRFAGKQKARPAIAPLVNLGIPKFDRNFSRPCAIIQWLTSTCDGFQMQHDTNMQSIVHILDDDDSLRRALDSLLRSVGLQTRTYGSVQEFLDANREDRPGCMVVDVRLPGLSGLDFHEQLASFGIHMPAVLITGHGDIPMSVRAMKAGAVDFLAKPFRDQDMLDAVAVALKRDTDRRTTDSVTALVRDRFATLSPREQQVMMLVTSGKMNKQVAGDLGLSEITVKIHRGSAMRKMSARTLADLVRMADIFKT